MLNSTYLLTNFLFYDLYPFKLQMVNSIFINFCNEKLMFDRLQIFHQKKNSTVFKGSRKNGNAAREAYLFFSRAILKYAMAHGSLHS